MSTLKQILSKKRDNELLFYINNPDKHTEEAIRLALDELQHRNVELPEDISERIEIQLKEKVTKAKESPKNEWTKNVVTDGWAPEYYSQRAIYIFSILFSVLFGAVMLAINCKNAGKKAWPVVLFGIGYLILTIMVLGNFPQRLSYTYIANGLGVIVMYELFWKPYIGADAKYRAKPIWIPLIVAMVLFIPWLILVISNLWK